MFEIQPGPQPEKPQKSLAHRIASNVMLAIFVGMAFLYLGDRPAFDSAMVAAVCVVILVMVLAICLVFLRILQKFGRWLKQP